ncbi:MAG: alpha/beta hydrolase [Thermoguttaceae bacterium]
MQRPNTASLGRQPDLSALHRKEICFRSRGRTCHAWLYRPPIGGLQRSRTSPCVVMAHGLGGTRDAGLVAFAERFAAAGFAALVFDYRHFGASQGQPRQLLWIRSQLQDWSAAIGVARTLPGVDPARIALWGSSLGAGHALVAAARDRRIAAVVCQCPMTDGLAAVLNVLEYAGFRQGWRLAAHGLWDLLAGVFGGVHYVPIVGPPGSLALMTTADAEPGYRAIAPRDFRWESAARIAVLLAFYRPIRSARHIRCPVLIQICLHDSVAPRRAAEATLRALGKRGHVQRYALGHFEVYRGGGFQQSVVDQLEFLGRHLAPGASAVQAAGLRLARPSAVL